MKVRRGLLALILLLAAAGPHAQTSFILSGTVYGGGTALPGAVIEALQDGTTTVAAQATANASGQYSLTLAPATYDLRVTPPAGSGFGQETVQNIVMDANRSYDVILLASTASARVFGTVRGYGGNPIANASVSVSSQSTGQYLGSGQTDAAGQFSVNASPGTVRVNVYGGWPRSPYAPPDWSVSQNSVTVAATGTEVNVDLPVVRVSGVVRGADGAVVPNASVSSNTSKYDSTLQRSYYASAGATADTSGAYALLLTAGSASFSVSPPSGSTYTPFSESGVTLTGDTTRDFVVPVAVRVTGTVRGYGGNPIANASVSVSSQSTGQYLGSGQTDAAGQFSVNASPGTVRVNVYGGWPRSPYAPPDWSVSQNSVTVGTTGAEVNVDLPVVRVSGVVRGADGAVVPNASVSSNTSKYDSTLQRSYYASAGATADASGAYALLLTAGSASFSVSPPSGSTYTPFSESGVTLTGDTTRDFVVPVAVRVTGTVRGYGGNPIANASVSVSSQSTGQYLGSGQTDAAGQFSVNASPGTVRVNVYGGWPRSPYAPPDWSVSQNSVTIGTTGAEVNVDLPVVRVNGSVGDSNGAPVPNVGISTNSSKYDSTLQRSYYSSAGTSSDSNGGYALLLMAGTASFSVSPPNQSGFSNTSIPSTTLLGNLTQRIILQRPDGTAPDIVSGPVVIHLSDTSVSIGWTTNEAATSRVDFGVGGLTSTLADNALTTNHSITLVDLLPIATYTFRVGSVDSSGNGPTFSAQGTFSTQAPPGDVTPPVITAGPTIAFVDQTRAIVQWTTDEPATTTASFGTTETLGSTVGEPFNRFRQTHSVSIDSLQPSTRYYVQVRSSDPDGNEIVGTTISFTTLAVPDTRAPAIVDGPSVTSATDTKLTVSWTTDEPATSGVSYNDGTRFFVASDSALTTTHVITLSSLQAQTTYNITVSSTDAVGNGPTLGGPIQSTTRATPDTTPPAITDLQVIEVKQTTATVVWNTSEPATTVVRFGPVAGAPDNSISSLTLVTTHRVMVTGLEAARQYFFTVGSADAARNLAESAEMSFKTAPVFVDMPPTAPGPLTASANPTRLDTVELFWSASTDDVALVRYEVLRDGSVVGTVEPFKTTFTDFGLADGRYEYRVRATDSASHTTDSDPLVVAVDRTPPVLNLPADLFADAANGVDAEVSFAVTATDNTDPAPAVSCAPGPGTFRIGTQDIACTATDRAGNAVMGRFNVTVRDVTAPILSLPAPIVIETTLPTGARVTYTAAATDNHDQAVTVDCQPASGSTVAVGQTIVGCSATDGAGNRSQGSFVVTVILRDTTPPTIVITSPANTIYTVGQSISATFSCTDTQSPVASCTGVSSIGGSAPVQSGAALDTSLAGRFTFTVTAVDGAGNTATGTVTYAVTRASDERPFWADAAALTTARNGHTMTLISDGRVLVIGGNDSSGLPTTAAEIYDPTLNQWMPIPSITVARSGHAAVRLGDGRVMILGGSTNPGITGTIEVYDPAANRWSAAPSMSIPRSAHSATLLNDGRVLVTGGYTPNSDPYQMYADSAEIFDPITSVWSTVAPMGTRRVVHTSTLLQDGRVLIAGGANYAEYVQTAELFNPTSRTWTPVPSLTDRRYGHVAALLSDGRVLVGGGANFFGRLSSAEIFVPNGTNGSWIAAAPMSTPRFSPVSAILSDGKVLVAGGVATGIVASAEIFDAASPSPWRTVASMHAARTYAAAVALRDGGVLVAGGSSTTMLGGAEIWNSARTITQLAIAPATGVYGGTMNLSATLTGFGSPLAGRQVAFMVNGQPVGTATTDAAGTATLIYTPAAGVAAGTYPQGIAATFSGDTLITPASAIGPLMLGQAQTTTTLTVSPSPSKAGQVVTLDARVVATTPALTPTGFVRFVDGSTVLDEVLAAGRASFSFLALSPGTHSFRAEYLGNTNVATSQSPTVAHEVTEALRRYTVTDTGVLAGADMTPSQLNGRRDIVGGASTPNGSRAFQYSGGALRDLSALLGGAASFAQAINKDGTLVGWTRDAAGQTRPFLLDRATGAVRDIAAAGVVGGIAYGINDGGTVVGGWWKDASSQTAFVYRDGHSAELGTFGGYASAAFDVNNLGTVVGVSLNAANENRAFIATERADRSWDVRDLLGEPGVAYAINDAGDVVGYKDFGPRHEPRAFLYHAGTITELGNLGYPSSIARGINSAGVAVGYSATRTGQTHGFVYSDGAMTDLNALLPADSRLQIRAAVDINDSGDILAIASVDGHDRAVILSFNRPPVVGASVMPSPAEATGAAGAIVSLDASASSDPDGDALTFEWHEGAKVIATSSVAAVTLPLGAHTIALVVSDGHGAQASTTVSVEVKDTIAPAITIAEPRGGGVYSLGQSVAADYTCSDVVAVASCDGPIPSGHNVDTSAPGVKSFRVDAVDSSGTTSSRAITYTVNTPPTAAEAKASTSEDTPIDISLSAIDPEGSPLTFAIVQQPSHGRLGSIRPVTGGAMVTYTPDADFAGLDAFKLTASDGFATSAVADVQITVTPVNDPPVVKQPAGRYLSLGVSLTNAGDVRAIATGDFNGDGLLDLAVGSSDMNGFGVLLAASDGSGWTAPTWYPASHPTLSVATADFNHDGKLDLVTAGGGVALWLGRGDGTFSPSVTGFGDGNPTWVAAADLNGDGNMDIAIAKFSGREVYFLIGDGAGGFSTSASVRVDLNLRSVIVGDWNRDGRLDLAVCGYEEATAASQVGRVAILYGDQNPLVFKAPIMYDVGLLPTQIVAGDFDGDGWPDLAVANAWSSAAASVLMNRADGTFAFAAAQQVQTGPASPAGTLNVMSIAAVDLNRDGRADLAAVNNVDKSIGILFASASGGLDPVKLYQVAGNPMFVAPADANGDGVVDLVVAQGGGTSISTLLNSIGPEPVIYRENARGVLVTPAVTVSDVDSADFDGGTLTLDITANATVDDRLGIFDDGSGLIYVFGNTIKFRGDVIGSFVGGTNGSDPFVVTFNANATAAAVQALARYLAFSNVSDTPSAASRTLRLVVTDGDGGTSAPAYAIVNIEPVNDAPVAIATASSAVPADGTSNDVQLDASQSYDVEGDAMTYQWRLDGRTIASGVRPTVRLSLGTNVITLIVTDAHGASGVSEPLSVRVYDATPPTIVDVPADMRLEATSAAGAAATWSGPNATDIVDGSVTVACDRPSGGVFPLGTTTVSCTAVDRAGNGATATFHVTVVDTTPPVITVPAPMTIEATSPQGAAVTYTASATDIVSGRVPVTCVPVSGTVVPFGTTTVRCTAGDAARNGAEKDFTVRVVDTTAPSVVIASPDTDVVEYGSAQPVFVDASDAAGVSAVFVNGLAARLITGTPLAGRWTVDVPVSLPVPSGSALTFTATARDAAGNTAATPPLVVDDDGINSEIDRRRWDGVDQRQFFSNDFVYRTTAGTLERNGWIVRALPGFDVVEISAVKPGPVGTFASVSACEGSSKEVRLDTPGETVQLSCASSGTITVKALIALPKIELRKVVVVFGGGGSGRFGVPPYFYSYLTSTSLTAGQKVSTGSPLTADPENTEPITAMLLRIDDNGHESVVGSMVLDPGEAADVQFIQGAPGQDDQVEIVGLAGDVDATIGGQTLRIKAGETHTPVIDRTPPAIATVDDRVVEATSARGATVSFALPAVTDNVDAQPMVMAAPASGSEFPIGSTSVTISATDVAGNRSERSFNVIVRDTTPPVVTVPANMTVEATSPSGAVATFSASALDLVDGATSVSCSPASGSSFPFGSTAVTCSSTDAHGNMGSSSFTVTVRDTTKPAIASVSPSVGSLWPPNHKMIAETIAVAASDAGDAAPMCRIAGVTSNEPVGADGDWAITGPTTLNLRAERLGSGTGRIYTIAVTCTDASGNTASKTTTVTVPHDQGK